MRKLSKLASSRSGKVNFERVWIPKGTDPYGRPLGVPKIEWRIWSWMNLNIMEIWCEGRGLKPQWQHGGLSRRGVVTAWKSIIPQLDEPNILEFDIKGFFNNINHSTIGEFVRHSKLNSFKEWIKETLESQPTKNNTPPLSEEREEFKQRTAIKNALMRNEEFSTLIGDHWESPEEMAAWMQDIMAFGEQHGLELDHRLLNEPITREEVDIERNLAFDLDKPGKGVPQGLGTSPYLAVMALAEVLRPVRGLTMYMDDGILTAKTYDQLMSRKLMLERQLELAGLTLAENKTYINKINGEWQRPLKFLGLVYQPEMDWIRSETRNGKVEQFPRATFAKELDSLWFSGNSGQIEIIKNVLDNTAHKIAREYGLLGLFMSKVYAPEMKVSERELIEIGINTAYTGMKNNSNTFIFDNRDAWHHIADNPKEVVTTSSTRMIRILLEDGFLVKRT